MKAKRLMIGLVVFFITCFSAGTFAQQKKDTKVSVKVPDTTGLFNRIALALSDRGYGIQRKDESLRVITTDEMAIGSRSVKYRLMIRDTLITISGDVASNVTLTLGGAKMERTYPDHELWNERK